MISNIATISLKINIDLEHRLSRIKLILQTGRLIRFTLSSRIEVEKVLLCLCFTYNIKNGGIPYTAHGEPIPTPPYFWFLFILNFYFFYVRLGLPRRVRAPRRGLELEEEKKGGVIFAQRAQRGRVPKNTQQPNRPTSGLNNINKKN